MKTSQQLDQKIHLKILSQNLQYERYENEKTNMVLMSSHYNGTVINVSDCYKYYFPVPYEFIFSSPAGSRQRD